MKSVILYAYPPEPDGLSMQGDMLYRGIKEKGGETMACNWQSKLQKEWIYKSFKPDVAVGIGYWGYTPEIVTHTQEFGITPVPWLVADGWVANYHKILSELPLVLTTSQWVTDTYQRDGVDTKNFRVAHIGVETDLFKPIPKTDPRIKKLREMIGIKDDEKVILTVGGDVTSKGAQEIFRALAKIKGDIGKWKYVCKSSESDCAEGHHEEEIGLMEELGLPRENVIFLGGMYSWDFMPILINAADIYAAPSRLEGFGMIQLEAEACGIPVVSIDHMGPKETIIHGKTGYLAKVASTVDLESELVYPHMGFDEEKRLYFDKPKTFAYRANIDELANYLKILLTDDKKREEMGKNGRELAIKKFHYHKTAEHVTNLLKDKLGLV